MNDEQHQLKQERNHLRCAFTTSSHKEYIAKCRDVGEKYGGSKGNSTTESSTKGSGKQRCQTSLTSCHISQWQPDKRDRENIALHR